ncbi:MAG: saccharopine dehydrogenase NADP-binding domain-containing protein, partial [Alphaproteobacteria bacterium]|nr:saccharopine dehydrogenase NADP-binding domain-containing protein [Alphaproteobacteria bacterium]
MARILIVGGYGAFGTRTAQRLASETTLEIVVAGRNLEHAQQAATDLDGRFPAAVTAAFVDSVAITSQQLATIEPDIIINASGPFQDQNTQLAQAAIENSCHYIDLADSRDFVVGIRKLDAAAQNANVLIVSGASSVPGLSSTVLCHLARDLASIDAVSITISPGNRFDPGEATTRSVLKGVGKPIETRRGGSSTIIYGWQDMRRRHFGALGSRWLGNVDVPDLQLIPEYFPEIA